MSAAKETVSEALAAAVLGMSVPALAVSSSALLVDELVCREAGRTGGLPRPTQLQLLDEITARIIVDERLRGDVELRQRVAKRWHHVMAKHWLPPELPAGASAAAIVRQYRGA